jgi:hypothetical protein
MKDEATKPGMSPHTHRKPVEPTPEPIAIPDGLGPDPAWSTCAREDYWEEQAQKYGAGRVLDWLATRRRFPVTLEALAGMLAQHGIVQPEAIDDPEGYDGENTMARIACVHADLCAATDWSAATPLAAERIDYPDENAAP